MAISNKCMACKWFPCLADDDDRHDEARAKETKDEVEAMKLVGDVELVYSGVHSAQCDAHKLKTMP